MNSRTVTTVLALAVLLGAGRSGYAENWLDPEPPLSWGATLASELVVLAKYDSHKAGELKLQILEVMKGKVDSRKPLTVKLEHLYSVETGPLVWYRFSAKPAADDKSVPKVCYKQQFINPGPLEPYPVRADARQPAIYFFPRADNPALKVRGQVQSPQSQKGWQQALDRKPIDLEFRLLQNVSLEISRDALEELGKSRDTVVLDKFFAWLLGRDHDAPFNTYQVTAYLARLGDRDGDVYDRASKLLFSVSPAKEEYFHLRLGTILAIVDQKRAMNDLPKWLDGKHPLPVRQAALYGLGRIPLRQAAQLALDSLRQDEIASIAIASLRSQLDGNSGDGLPKNHGLEKDQEWLHEELREGLVDERVSDQVKTQIRESFGKIDRKRPLLDLDALRKTLLDLKNPSYQEYGKGSPPPKASDEITSFMLRDVREECDPRVVPILAEVLEKVPDAARDHAYAFQETLTFYARICPRAMKKELLQRSLPGKLAALPSHELSYQIHNALEAAQIWPSRHKPYLEEEINRCYELAAEVRAGKSEQTEALLKAVDELHAKHESRGQAAFPALIDSGSPAARDKFFDYLNKAKQGRLNRWSNQLTLWEVSEVISPLHAKHPKLHVKLVLELLKSKSLAEREAGAGCLGSAWRSDFGFDYEALEADRIRQLAEAQPLILKVAAVSDTQAHAILLTRAGYEVTGEPNDSWLPTLQKAAGTRGEAARHAMKLVEAVMGEEQCREFAYLPPPQRVRALKAYLADAGRLKGPVGK